MRIAFFSDAYHPRVSGQVSSIDEFCKILVKRGHEVRIVCPSYPSGREAPDPFPCIRVPSGSGIVSDEDRLALPWLAGRALKKLDEFRPQAVHVQTEFTIGTMGRRYCRRRGLPVLSTCHTHYEMYLKEYLPLLPEGPGKTGARLWLRSVYAHDDLIVTPSRNIRDILISFGLNKPYEVIPTGVDEKIFSPQPEEARRLRENLEHAHRGFGKGHLLIYVGRIRREKNLHLLADAFVRIARAVPDANLLFVGEGPLQTELRHFFEAEGLGARVAWEGYMDREELPAYYSAADIFVFPSKTETQGLVTIEAMLCGTPVVGVNRMGTAEILAGDSGGLLAEDDPQDFADKTLSLINDPELRLAKSLQAREHALAWSTASSGDKIENLYFRLFGNPGRRVPSPLPSSTRASAG